MMPRLEAEAQLTAIDTAALGAGSYDRATSSRMLRELRERARGDAGARPRRKANPAQLGQMGIGVRQAAPKKALSGV